VFHSVILFAAEVVQYKIDIIEIYPGLAHGCPSDTTRNKRTTTQHVSSNLFKPGNNKYISIYNGHHGNDIHVYSHNIIYNNK